MLLHDMMSGTRYGKTSFLREPPLQKRCQNLQKKLKKPFYYKFNICPTSPEFQTDAEYLNLDLSRSRFIFQSANICLSEWALSMTLWSSVSSWSLN